MFTSIFMTRGEKFFLNVSNANSYTMKGGARMPSFFGRRANLSTIAVALFVMGVSLQPAKAVTYTGSILYPITNAGTAVTIANGQAVGYGGSSRIGGYALIWSASDGSTTDVNPAGFTASYLKATDGVQQVGYALGSSDYYQAMLWSGTAASAVNLNPAGFLGSIAYGIDGNQQVGGGTMGGSGSNALLWSGTAASAVDLNPAGFTNSTAVGISGNQQVGYGYSSSMQNKDHALLWSGTAASVVDLNPTGFTTSQAFGTAGNQQVGVGQDDSTGEYHALLWTGTAASVIDLNPTNLGFKSSAAEATNGAEQVGSGSFSSAGNYENALLWTGTAASAVNLQLLLPSPTQWQDSYADSIDANGNIFGLAFGTYEGYYAVEWSPVPEPGSFAILAVGTFGLLCRRRGSGRF